MNYVPIYFPIDTHEMPNQHLAAIIKEDGCLVSKYTDRLASKWQGRIQGGVLGVKTPTLFGKFFQFARVF